MYELNQTSVLKKNTRYSTIEITRANNIRGNKKSGKKTERFL